MKKIELVVTRHPALLEYLREIGVVTKEVMVTSHATIEDVAGKNVCGVLPHSLSAACRTFSEVPLSLPVELRGKELALAEIKKYAGELVTYTVTRVCAENHAPEKWLT